MKVQPQPQSQSQSQSQPSDNIDKLREEILQMGKIMNDLSEEQIEGIREKLMGQTYENVKSLHEQALEKYQ